MTINQLPVEDWSKTRENSAGETEPTCNRADGARLLTLQLGLASRNDEGLQTSITPTAMVGTGGDKPVNGIGADARER